MVQIVFLVMGSLLVVGGIVCLVPKGERGTSAPGLAVLLFAAGATAFIFGLVGISYIYNAGENGWGRESRSSGDFTIVSVVVVGFLLLSFLAWSMSGARRGRRVMQEREPPERRSAIGSLGRTLDKLSPTGRVQVLGTTRSARTQGETIEAGREVLVVAFDPLGLIVREVPAESGEPGSTGERESTSQRDYRQLCYQCGRPLMVGEEGSRLCELCR